MHAWGRTGGRKDGGVSEWLKFERAIERLRGKKSADTHSGWFVQYCC